MVKVVKVGNEVSDGGGRVGVGRVDDFASVSEHPGGDGGESVDCVCGRDECERASRGVFSSEQPSGLREALAIDSERRPGAHFVADGGSSTHMRLE